MFTNILLEPLWHGLFFNERLFLIFRNQSRKRKTFGKTRRDQSAEDWFLPKSPGLWPHLKMRAYQNFILSRPIRRNRSLRFPQGDAGWPAYRTCCPRAYFVGTGRHTFKKFYLKKKIIDNISHQKKHTFLMIKDDNKMMILRPLLKFSRFEFLKFCEFWSLPIIPDFTNFNVYFRRNNLRLQLIPYLKIFLNLNLFQKIDQFQQILQLENQYLQFFFKKIHGATFYGEAAGRLGRAFKGDAPLGGRPQAASPSKPKGPRFGPLGQRGKKRVPLSQRLKTEGWKPPSSSRSRANTVSGTFSLLTDPARGPFGTPVSPKNRCLFYDYRKNYFFYFPKIFQYLIIHNFYYFVSKKISFKEIYCILKKLKEKDGPQSKSK